MNRDQKAQTVDRIAGEIEHADAILALDYRGISVKQAAELRTALLEAGASFRVVKNTLTERAADKAGAESLKELLEGPTALTFVRGDIALAAKTLATFRRREGVLEIKGGRMDGETLTIEQIETIARLPARDVLHSQFVGTLASPLTTLVRGLASMISGLAIALRQVEEQGLIGTAEQPAADEGPEATGAGGEAEPAAESEAPVADAEAPAETERPAAEEPAAEAPAAEAEPAAEGEAAAPADEAEQPSEAPGDPVAEAEAAEEESEATPSEGGSESEEG